MSSRGKRSPRAIHSLHTAAADGLLNFVRKHLRRDPASINTTAATGSTALLLASHNNHIDIVKHLLAVPGVDVDLANNVGGTPLIAACDKGRADVVRLLVSGGADVNKGADPAKSRWGPFTPLSAACLAGCTKAVKHLLAARDIDVNARDPDGATALHNAISVTWGEGDSGTEIIRLLAAHPRIDVHAACKNGDTPQSRAYERDRMDIVTLLEDVASSESSESSPPPSPPPPSPSSSPAPDAVASASSPAVPSSPAAAVEAVPSSVAAVAAPAPPRRRPRQSPSSDRGVQGGREPKRRRSSRSSVGAVAANSPPSLHKAFSIQRRPGNTNFVCACGCGMKTWRLCLQCELPVRAVCWEEFAHQHPVDLSKRSKRPKRLASIAKAVAGAAAR